MRLVMADHVEWDYTVETVYQRPLGGSQSAFCYLAEQLAARGHEVFLANNTAGEATARGVRCLPLKSLPPEFWAAADAVVALNSPKRAALDIRPLLRPAAPLILWTQHAADQPSVQPLSRAEIRDAFSHVAFVSDWQRETFEQRFGLDPQRARVMRNAIGPAFRGLFAPGERITAAKRRPPVLAYTSAAYRGLDLLVHLFPEIRRRVPDARLQIFSSMQVYQVAAGADEAEYGRLYRQCRETEGIEYVGSLAQPDLAPRLREATLLAYPNHFAETSCIAAMEALAAGCQIVTSDLGALPETTAGFARLVPTSDDWLAYSDRFVAEAVDALEESSHMPAKLEEDLARQVAHVNDQCVWDRRAAEWETWLAELIDTSPTR